MEESGLTGLGVHVPETQFFPRNHRTGGNDRRLEPFFVNVVTDFLNARRPSGLGKRVQCTQDELVRVTEGRSGGWSCCAGEGFNFFVEVGGVAEKGTEGGARSAPD